MGGKKQLIIMAG